MNGNLNRHKLVLISVLLITFLSACKQQDNSNSNIFFYNEVTGIASLDPAFAKNQSIMWPVHQLYNTLLEVDDSLHIVPSIATSWHSDSARTSFTFKLRRDVFFHNDPCFNNGVGRRLLAQDVVYSFNRLITPATASPGAWIFNNRVDSLEPFSAPDDSTFVLKLRTPFHPVLGILTMQYCSIVPREAVEKYGTDFRRHPVGSGPFSFLAWEEGQSLLLKKNENYFERDEHGKSLPYLEGICVKFYDSKSTEFLDFQQKRLDFMNDIDPSFKDEVLTKTGNLKTTWEKTITLKKHAYLNIEYLGINVDSTSIPAKGSALQNKLIRQAINYGIDKRKLMLYLRNSIGMPAVNGFVPPGLPSYTNALKGYDYNPVKATQLLTEAGYPGGKNLPVIKLLSIPVYANLASFIARELEKINIKVEVEIVQKSLLLQLTSKQEAPFFRASWIADYPDAENYLSVLYGKNPAPPNYTRYANPVFDKLYEAALAEVDNEKRYTLYRKMDSIAIADAPFVPLWYDEAIHFVQNNIIDFEPNSLNLLELRRVKKLTY